MGTDSKIDRENVVLATEVERLYWATKLGADAGDMSSAIAAVGSNPRAVADWLRNAHKCHLRPEAVAAPESGIVPP